MQRLLPPTLVFLLLVMAGVLAWFAPGPHIPTPGRFAGVVVAGAGTVVCVTASRMFASVGTNIKTFDDPEILVETGPFRFSRNPMYLGFTMLLFGAALALGALTPFIAPTLFVAAASWWYIPFEEARAAERFGTDYDSYRSNVRRWL